VDIESASDELAPFPCIRTGPRVALGSLRPAQHSRSIDV
jgi:hypothetical protein